MNVVATVEPKKLDEFNDEILECVDKGLNVFGLQLRHAVYFLSSRLGTDESKGIISNPKVWTDELRAFFGAGSQQIESSIVMEIRRRFGLWDLSETDGFPLALEAARRHFILQD